MNELRSALKIARDILDSELEGELDDLTDGRILLARQLVSQYEANGKLHEALAAAQDPTGDLIHANRDLILEIHQESLRRIKHCVKINQTELIPLVIEAACSFHPMHSEGWSWPEGSDYRQGK